jgi:hypothetical protein
MARKDTPGLPQPPEIKRQLHLAPEQMVGVALLLLFVLLGSFRVFGAVTGQVVSEDTPLRLEVTYPERTRLGMRGTIEARLTNTGTEDLEIVIARFHRSFIDAFSPEFMPAADRIKTLSYEVDLADVLPGETRVVLVDVEAAAESSPTVLAHHGRLIEENLNRERISPDELYSHIRKSGLERIEEVRWAVLESDGKISIVPKSS